MFAMLNDDVLNPIPSARVRMAVHVNPGTLLKERRACWSCWRMVAKILRGVAARVGGFESRHSDRSVSTGSTMVARRAGT